MYRHTKCCIINLVWFRYVLEKALHTERNNPQTVCMERVRKAMLRRVLPNGMRVVCECLPGYRSVSMGVWINAGSVYELGSESGAAHFIEHMLFKGTKNRSASDIAEEMDAVGGNLNAFTSKECTCFYGRVLLRDAGTLASVLSDLIENSVLDPKDIELEKGVVCEEIAMTEDTPEDLVSDTAASGFYEGDPLERPILGTAESVRGFTREGLASYMERLYQPDNMVLAVAGNIDEEGLDRLLERSFLFTGKSEGHDVDFSRHTPGRRLKLIGKEIEQAHIAICLNGFKKDTPESYAMLLFSNAFGGSMSSRLFRRIREENGLAYSVYSYPTAYSNSGYLTLYAGTGAENAVTVTQMMLEEIRRVRADGLTREELLRAKDQLIASFIMAQESTSARASAIGRSELLRGSHLTEDEIIARIEAVGMEDIEAVIPKALTLDDFSACFVGRIGESGEELKKLLLG